MMKRLYSLVLALVLCLTLSVPVLAAGTGLLRDDADLLTAREESELEQELERISRAYGTDVIVVTVAAVGNRWVDDYTQDYFDSNFGRSHDGILLLVTMAEREYRILSNGLGAAALSDSDIDAICGHIEPYLRDGDYAAAFLRFAQDCERELDGEINGVPFEFGKSLLISVVVGFLVALVVVLVLASQLRSARRRNTAGEYQRRGSFRLTGSSDLYLYRNVTRRPRQNNSPGGRGGGPRHGGGGHHHGGGRNMGGGRF